MDGDKYNIPKYIIQNVFINDLHLKFEIFSVNYLSMISIILLIFKNFEHDKKIITIPYLAPPIFPQRRDTTLLLSPQSLYSNGRTPPPSVSDASSADCPKPAPKPPRSSLPRAVFADSEGSR
jgi:hypothetical protein